MKRLRMGLGCFLMSCWACACSSSSGGDDGSGGGLGFGGGAGTGGAAGNGGGAGNGGTAGSGGRAGASGAAGATCTPPTETFAVGDTAQACDYSLTVLSVTQCEPAFSYATPAPGHLWLGVNVIVAATSPITVWSNPSHGSVVDGSGLSYSYTFASTKNCDPGLTATQLDQGDQTGGWVVFEIPDTATGMKMIYDPSLSAPQPITFDLGW